MTPAPLAPRDVAEARRVKIGTVYRYLTLTRDRLRAGLPLRPMDLPLPDAQDSPPRWSADGPIALWLARTAGRPAGQVGASPRKDTT